MADDNSINSYEEVRRQRVLDNKKRFEDLGILNISKNLCDLTKSEKKSGYKTELRRVRQKANDVYLSEPRRSARARNPVPTYRDEIDIELPSLRRRSKFNSSWASYLARPFEEVKVASYEEKVQALKCAEKLQSNLQSENPFFIKTMVRSHVYSCFWLNDHLASPGLHETRWEQVGVFSCQLRPTKMSRCALSKLGEGLPSKFCLDHLPESTVNVLLVDEEGLEYEALFIGKRTGLSGGWRAFALDHKLDDGDALVFELVEPTKFKVYIVRASQCSSGVDKSGAENEEHEAEETSKSVTKKTKKRSNKSEAPAVAKEESEAEETSKSVTKKTKKSSNKSEVPAVAKEESEAEETSKSVTKKRKKSSNKSEVPAIAKEESEAEETSKSVTKKRKKSSNKSEVPAIAKEESEAEETSKSVTKKRKKSSNKSEVPAIAKEEVPVMASATRRSTRRK